MNCPYCNHKNRPDARFCANCRAPLAPAAPPAAEPPAAEQPPAGPMPTAPSQQQPVSGGYGQPHTPTQQPAQHPPTASMGGGPVPSAPSQAPIIRQGTGQAGPAPAEWSSAYPQGYTPTLKVRAAPKKKSSKGCIIAVVVLGAAGLLIAVVAVLLLIYLGYGDIAQFTEGEYEGAGKQEMADDESKEKEPKESSEAVSSAKANPRVKETPKSELYKSRIFEPKDKIRYAGTTFSVKKSIKVYTKAAIPDKIKLKKGYCMADVEIAVYGKAKINKYSVALIDGKGKKRWPDSSVEKYMELPEHSKKTHKLWKKVTTVPSGKTYYLHSGFSVPVKSAKYFIVQIQDVSSDRVLWIEAEHKVYSK